MFRLLYWTHKYTQQEQKNEDYRKKKEEKNTCSIPEAKVDSASIHNNISTEVVKHSRYIILHKKYNDS